MITANELLQRKCRRLDAGLSDADLPGYLAAVGDWTLQDGKIAKTFRFNNYYETLAFVNAIAYMIHKEDHHPDLTITYNRCTVEFSTHSVNGGQGGISENDFICAAKVNAIFQQDGI